MVTCYAESSAIVAWLLGEEEGEPVRRCLASAHLVIASDLSLVECDRVLRRAVTLGDLSDADAAQRRGRLAEAAEHWVVLAIDREIIERARGPFPREPIRTLDAIHLATALQARNLVTQMQVLTLDARMRANARALGFDIAPAC